MRKPSAFHQTGLQKMHVLSLEDCLEWVKSVARTVCTPLILFSLELEDRISFCFKRLKTLILKKKFKIIIKKVKKK